MKPLNPTLGKILYGLTFTVLLPAFLWYWSRQTESLIRFHALFYPLAGRVLTGAGVVLVLWGMWALYRYGRGLPMNAYPPPQFVTQGPYRLFRHPVYLGFVLVCAGVSLWTVSASGLWLVTPVVILGIEALLLGYEEVALLQRFPDGQGDALFSLPKGGEQPPAPARRLAAALLVLVPWYVGSWLTAAAFNSFVPSLGLASEWPAYLGAALVTATPFLVRTASHLRAWTISCLAAAGIALALVWLAPRSPASLFVAGLDGWMAATAGHLPLILLSARALAWRSLRVNPLVWLLTVWLGLMIVLNSQEPLWYGIMSFTIAIIAARTGWIWERLRRFAEAVANSWREWTLGPVRIINHGLYPGIGAFGGTLLTGVLAGKTYAWGVVAFGVVVIVCAGLWGQLVEGSDKLKRPFGFFGGLLGTVFASLLVWMLGYDVWVMLGVFSVAMPFTQGIGRLRCLVNGCCHGSPADDATGIHYLHPRSRVFHLSGMQGIPLHPTPLYSLLSLLATGAVMLRLWYSGMDYPFIAGMYLILTGVCRFVEEAYRGEVQTPVLGGLRLYQWAAIASLLAGIGMTMWMVPRTELVPEWGNEVWAAAAVNGLFAFFAMGVDFPNSNARFSRLV